MGSGALIFVTIGALFPFDRLVRLMDEMAPTMPGQTFFAQIGEGAYEPRNMPFARLVKAAQFRQLVADCDLMVAHAGMGSVLSALEARKPIVLLPRSMELLEHTTDHQMATARWLEGRPGIRIAMTDAELRPTIEQSLAAGAMRDPLPISAPEPFLRRIRSFIDAA